MTDETTQFYYMQSLLQLPLDSLNFSLKPSAQPGSRAVLTHSPYRPDTFSRGPAYAGSSLSVLELKAPGKPTDQVLDRFCAHPLASVAVTDVSDAKALLSKTPARAAKHKLPSGMEYFAWRHLYVKHPDEAVSTIWRFRVSILIPKSQKDVKTWRDIAPLLTVSLVNAWELVREGTPTQQPALKSLAEMLMLTLTSLVADALYTLEQSIEDSADYLLNEIPVRLRMMVSPQASRHEKTVTKLATYLQGNANPPDGLELSLDDYINYIELAEVTSGIMSPEEQELAASSEIRVPPPAKKSGVPGETYIFLEGACPELLLTKDAKVYPAYLKERYDYFLSEYRLTPSALLKEFGCHSQEFAEFTSTGTPPRFTGEPEHKIRQWLMESSDIEDDFELERIASDLAEAATAVGGFKAEPKIVLRILADKATRVSYAWIGEASAPLAGFFEKALAGGIRSPLTGIPSNLQAPRSYCSAHPELVNWCASKGITLTHPKSGFASGIDLLKQWRYDIRTLDPYCQRLLNLESTPEVRDASDLVKLSRMQLLVENQAWAVINNRRQFSFGFSCMTVDEDAYFSTVRPSEDIAELSSRRISWVREQLLNT